MLWPGCPMIRMGFKCDCYSIRRLPDDLISAGGRGAVGNAFTFDAQESVHLLWRAGPNCPLRRDSWSATGKNAANAPTSIATSVHKSNSPAVRADDFSRWFRVADNNSHLDFLVGDGQAEQHLVEIDVRYDSDKSQLRRQRLRRVGLG
jgi:hypothetical protein